MQKIKSTGDIYDGLKNTVSILKLMGSSIGFTELQNMKYAEVIRLIIQNGGKVTIEPPKHIKITIENTGYIT